MGELLPNHNRDQHAKLVRVNGGVVDPMYRHFVERRGSAEQVYVWDSKPMPGYGPTYPAQTVYFGAMLPAPYPYFRSKEEGICPYGWIPRQDAMCEPVNEPNTKFYAKDGVQRSVINRERAV